MLTVLVVVVHFVVGPYSAQVAIRIHAVVHVMNVRTFDVPVHVDIVEYLGVGPWCAATPSAGKRVKRQ